MARLWVVATTGSLLAVRAAALAAQAQAPSEYQIDTVWVDSLARERPGATLSELLSGRAAGIYGSSEVPLTNLRALGSPDGRVPPLVFVDGARYTTSWQEPFNSTIIAGPNGFDAGHPLDDLDPNEVEMVEILKGPAATALYGTGSANGVLRITTKHGTIGPPRGNVYGRRRTIEMARINPLYEYHAWGHTLSGGAPVDGCTYTHLYMGSPCMGDSVTVETPLAALRPTRAIGGLTYGGNVTGGNAAWRYFLSASADGDDGFTKFGTGTTDEPMISPLGFSRVNLRANLAHQVGKGDVGLNVGYVLGSGSGSVVPTTVSNLSANERLRHLTGSARARMPLASWLVANGTVGYERGHRRQGTFETYPAPGDSVNLTRVSGDTVLQRTTTAQLSLVAAENGGRITGSTSFGGDYTWWHIFDDGGESVVGANDQPLSTSRYHQSDDTRTRGIYLDQRLSLNERLTITGGFRVEWAGRLDRASDARTYPRLTASWRPTGEPWMPRLPGAFDIRLRYAFGVSGDFVQPGGSPVSVQVIPTSPSSTPFWDGQPDRVSEHEAGLDLDGLGHRLQVSLVRYWRHTENWPAVGPIASSVYGDAFTVAVASEIAQNGFEAGVTARLIENRWLDWSVSLRHASTTSAFDSNAALTSFYSYGLGFVPGYPVGALFRNPPIAGYADVNGDGVLESSEVQFGAGYEYLGATAPRRVQSLGTTVGLFGRRLRLAGMLERQSGYVRADLLETQLCREGHCQAAVDPSTPLAQQAEVVAIQASSSGYFLAEPADFTRLRELSATIDLPRGMAAAVRARSLGLTLAGRNLATWTDVTGVDPETNDIMSPAKSWMVRLDVGF